MFRNRYRVIRLLGEGGFRRTYEARDVDRMDDRCVIKHWWGKSTTKNHVFVSLYITNHKGNLFDGILNVRDVNVDWT